MRGLIVLLMLAGLAGCGVRADLTPPPGKALPVAPYGSDVPKAAADLLVPPQQAAPERSVELRKRSEPREEDPFDLPPRE